MSRRKQLQSNIWKYFVYSFSQRRNFYPILSIFFLTLPDATTKQIGIWSGIGFIASFFFEIPSSYFADRFGHKKTLVMAKVLMTISTGSFVFANSWIWFIIGSALLSISLAFASGTDSAFIHNTMVESRREHEYTKLKSKLSANVSLLSTIPIILLPFFTAVSIRLPLQIWLVVDIIGLIIAFSFVSPRIRFEAEEDKVSVWKIAKQLYGTGFYPFSIFIGIIGGYIVAVSNFNNVYLQSIGYPVVLLGFVMGVSRFVWFLIGHNIHKIEEKFGMHAMLVFEMIFFPLMISLIIIFKNPYFVAAIICIMIGYYWGRCPMMDGYTLKHFVVNKKYKATLISLQSQIEGIFQAIFAFCFGYLMAISFKLGYSAGLLAMLIVMVISYIYCKKHLPLPIRTQ